MKTKSKANIKENFEIDKEKIGDHAKHHMNAILYDIEECFPKQQIIIFQSLSTFPVETMPPSLDSDLLITLRKQWDRCSNYYANNLKNHYELVSQ